MSQSTVRTLAVWFCPPEPKSGVRVSVGAATAVTGADGKFVLRDVPVGRRTVRVGDPVVHDEALTVKAPQTYYSYPLRPTFGLVDARACPP